MMARRIVGGERVLDALPDRAGPAMRGFERIELRSGLFRDSPIEEASPGVAGLLLSEGERRGRPFGSGGGIRPLIEGLELPGRRRSPPPG
jgi:hypothetical protein